MSPMRACAERWRSLGRATVQWEARSLSAFGDQPLEEVAGDYDLVVIDHPFCGRAAQTGCLTPLDELLDEDDALRAARRRGRTEPRSYAHAGHQWGLATDAACQVAAVRDDLMAEARRRGSWDEVLDLAARPAGSGRAAALASARHLELAQHRRGARRRAVCKRLGRCSRHRDRWRSSPARSA